MLPRTSLLAVLLVAVALLAPSVADAAVARTFFATQGWHQPTAASYGAIRRANVGTYRLLVGWASVEPRPGQRFWGYYDRLIGQAAANDLYVLPLLHLSPSFISSDSRVAPKTPGGREAFSAFVRDAVRRYGKNGSFWRENPNIPYRPPIGWQIWNEPSAYGLNTPADYRALVKSAATAIRGVNANERVVLGGIGGPRKGPLYLAELYKDPSFKNYFDVAAAHPYHQTEVEVEQVIQRFRAEMTNGRDGSTPLWITEVGWSTSGPTTRLRVDLAGQATRLERTYSMLLRQRTRYQIGMVAWFCLQDRARTAEEIASGGGIYAGMGLFDLSGRPKPALSALTRITGGRTTTSIGPVG